MLEKEDMLGSTIFEFKMSMIKLSEFLKSQFVMVKRGIMPYRRI